MVDPVNFTNFNRTEIELQEVALFSVLVAGKNAVRTANTLNSMLAVTPEKPFDYFRNFTELFLQQLLKSNGIGCYRNKAKSIYQLVRSGLDLKTCSVSDLEQIYGIGPKTARMFVLHTRSNSNVACLDVHILRWLRDSGYDVPRATPSSKKMYAKIEKIFLDLALKSGKSVAEFDLTIWNMYRMKKTA